jgi:NitT/TauT family transport system permease protein
LRTIGTPLLAVATILLAWQLLSGKVINELYISKPSAIWSAIRQLEVSGQLAANLPVTLEEAAYGFLLGVVIAVPVAIMLARSRTLLSVSSPVIIAFYCIPRLALGPLFIIWFGIGVPMKVWLTASIVFFPMYFTVFDGAREVDVSYVNSAKIMGASRWYILWHISLPSMLTWLFVGIRQALPFALTGAVVGELIVATHGMGYLLAQAAGSYQTSQLMAVLLIIGLIGYLANALLNIVERYVFRWKAPSSSSGYRAVRTKRNRGTRGEANLS